MMNMQFSLILLVLGTASELCYIGDKEDWDLEYNWQIITN